jgi:hypothetical protein
LIVNFVPQTTNSGTATLAVGGQSAKILKQADCATNIPSGGIVAASNYAFFYNGTNLCQMSSNPVTAGYGLQSAMIGGNTQISLNQSIAPDITAGWANTPGAKVVLPPSATNAGLNVGPGSSLATVPVQGDLQGDSAGQLNNYDGAAWRQLAFYGGTNSSPSYVMCQDGTNQNGIDRCGNLPANLQLQTATLVNPTITSLQGNGIWGSSSLTFTSIPVVGSGTACQDQSFTLAGAVAGEYLLEGWPAAYWAAAGAQGSMGVSAANTVTVRVCNLSGSPLSIAAATYKATILR